MAFHLIPVLEKMEALYELPRDKKRFDTYLSMLQGENEEDMVLPIGAYNPMAKADALEKLRELKSLNAELLALEIIDNVNRSAKLNTSQNIGVVLNLADDVGGSWSSRFTTDYSSKFDFDPILKRNFSTPHFWTSEAYTESVIIQRIMEYLQRSIYWINNGKPITLMDHVNQEVYVRSSTDDEIKFQNITTLDAFYQQNKHSEDYGLIFNFFYGDDASRILNYKCYGIPEMGGWHFINTAPRSLKTE